MVISDYINNSDQLLIITITKNNERQEPQNPELFTVLHDMGIAEHKCQIVGNRFLLDVPDKMAVIVHRRYTDEENARLKEEWLACGERGGVLVSSPWAFHMEKKTITRVQCLELNAMAERIASNG